jgi:hypothetical protein
VKISILALDKRQEMWTKLAKQVNGLFQTKCELFIVGKDNNPELNYSHHDALEVDRPLYYPGQNPLNHFNAFLSHKRMIRQAIHEDVDKLLIMEDDAYIIEDRFYRIWKHTSVQNFLKSDKWDILYLGWWHNKPGYTSGDREDLEELWKTEGKCGIDKVPRPPEMAHEICGLHGLLINKHFLPKMLLAPTGPYDSWLNRHLDKINAYYMWPKLIHVNTAWSYCENGETVRAKLE